MGGGGGGGEEEKKKEGKIGMGEGELQTHSTTFFQVFY